ncbi:MAG TPA: uroporphyrinogen-III C-methyltransferase [Burkholderiales bacterium]|jgi:uroporphyrin-III C-methyltransferase|nr:uroporphyrinogen-III C-methyltransferase [Burkholderiales bacterium]
MKPGKVYLVGAGPGDPELLTLKAVKALARADVVMLDDLVDRRVLDYAPGARVIEVGKRGGCKSTPQAFIERLMVRLASHGNVVARIKGGDPFVFGRGGEEALTLARAGIECEVIPGITAGIGVPAALGIPVTHRGLARGVTFVTGHTRDGSGPDWAALARTDTTLVIYMGMQRVVEITAALQAAGMPATTPAAAIQNGTTEFERHVIATLATLADAARAAVLGSPSLIVIGEVVGLARATEIAGVQLRTA